MRTGLEITRLSANVWLNAKMKKSINPRKNTSAHAEEQREAFVEHASRGFAKAVTTALLELEQERQQEKENQEKKSESVLVLAD